MAQEDDGSSQEAQPPQETSVETRQRAQASTEIRAESSTNIVPSVVNGEASRTTSMSPLVLGNDLLSSLPPTSHTGGDILDPESDTMFSGDLDVQIAVNGDDWQEPVVLDTASSETIKKELPPSVDHVTSVTNVLPDILGENSFSSVKADLLAKMQKIDGLILNAQQIQKKYQGVTDSDSLRSIEDMLHKLFAQKVELQNELALLLTVNDKIGRGPEHSTSGRQSTAETTQASLNRQHPLTVKSSPVVPSTVTAASTRQMDIAKSIRDLVNNLQDITKQKSDLEKMVQVLHVRKSQAQSKEEEEHFDMLIHRHEVQVKELDRTVSDASKTLATMKQIHRQLGGLVEDQENEEEAPPDASLIALRSRLNMMRTRLDDITQETEQPQSSSSTLRQSTSHDHPNDSQRDFRILAGRHDKDGNEHYHQQQQNMSHQQQRGFRLQTADLMFPAEGLNQRRDLNNTDRYPAKIHIDNREATDRPYNRFVIDNIHTSSDNASHHPPLMDDQRPYSSYVPLNDVPSSDSEAEHAAEMKLQAMYNTTPKKNLNSRSWKNAAGSSRAFDESSSAVQNDLMPEVLVSLQTMISEQQKILNHCANFMSKQQSGQCASRCSPTPESAMQRLDRDRIPFINNTLRETSQYSYNIPPSSGRHRAKPRRDNSQYAPSGGLLNNQRNDARMSSVSPNIADYTHSSDYCDNREMGRYQNTSAASRADQAAPIRELMERILHQYENDLGSLHYMLDCLASVRSKQGRAAVAAQLGTAVAVECAKTDKVLKAHTFVSLPFSASTSSNSQQYTQTNGQYPALPLDPRNSRVLPTRQCLTEEHRRQAHSTNNPSLGQIAPDLVGSGSSRMFETDRNSHPSVTDRSNGTLSIVDQVQQRLLQMRSENRAMLPQGLNTYPFASRNMTQSDELVNNAIRMGLPRNNMPQEGIGSYLTSNSGNLTSDEYCDPHSGASGASADYDMVRDFGQNM